MEQRLNKQEKQIKHDADVLTRLRSLAVKSIEKDMLSKLAPLGMPNIRFVIQMTASDAFSPTGQDKVTFLFSANTSTPLQPIAQVASGGEIARVMLSLKAMISAAVKLPTIIFDEIDTGVSGKIAEKMAEIMCEMGQKERQVISITHLPQIAALGTTHYRVEKEDDTQRTTSRMKELTTEERIREIAQMLSGTDITEAAIQNAKQLLRL
jgi:DNA repair protein RecN (Recombination protein N)